MTVTSRVVYLLVSDLPPNAAVELDVYMMEHPEHDLSRHLLRRVIADASGPPKQFILEYPGCARHYRDFGATHLDPGVCGCLIWRNEYVNGRCGWETYQ